ncbi:unnamed protein product [Coregonus sp. 'balchen']|nr:unnamed protein product [Coregonus sp. 'balchen']
MSFLPPRPEEGDVLPASKTRRGSAGSSLPTGLCNFIFVSVVSSLQVMMEVLNHLSALLLLSLLPPSLSHVVGKFSDVTDCEKFFIHNFFLERTTPNIPGILVGGKVQDPDRYKPICQKYEGKYRFATLYDTTNKIPVFSAYTFTGPPTGKRQKEPSWMIEPQLNNINNSHEMRSDEGQYPDHQAGDNDYLNKMRDEKLSRGHLFPALHAIDQETKDSTFTLTNIVPQVVSFNIGSWNNTECKVRNTLLNHFKDANNNIEAYVVTGAVPSTNNIEEKNKLNIRVNIPSLLWTAYCCKINQDEWVAGAHWGENQGEGKGETIASKTLAKLYVELDLHYPGPGVQVFPKECLTGGSRKRTIETGDELEGSRKKPKLTADNPTALRLVGGDVPDHCVYDDECVCSSVGNKGHYLPVVLFSVLVMMEVLNHLSALLLLSLLPPSLSEVVNRFDPNCSHFFLNGTTPNITDILVGGRVQNQNHNPDRYKLICQKYKNSYRFATLYDTTNKIPVFSAYTFTGPFKGKRPDKWMIEPKLNEVDRTNPEMVVNLPLYQAGNNDYLNNGRNLSRGHLFPNSHAHDQETQNSTFTLTNIVPQVVSFNGGSWKDMECKVRNTLNDNCKDANNIIEAYVVTGAVPSESNTLNNRVNIPSLLWTAYCCYNSTQRQWVAGAHWGENIEKGETLTKTLAELYEKLSELYEMLNPGGGGERPGVQVFPDECSADNPTALRLVGGDVHDHCVYDDECVCSSVGIKGHYLPVVLFSVLVPEQVRFKCNQSSLKGGNPPNLPGILVDGDSQDQNAYKPICQKLQLSTTTTTRSLFSAYTFTGPPTDKTKSHPGYRSPSQRHKKQPEMSEDTGSLQSTRLGNNDYL